jgi:hypothetical protein
MEMRNSKTIRIFTGVSRVFSVRKFARQASSISKLSGRLAGKPEKRGISMNANMERFYEPFNNFRLSCRFPKTG